MNEPFARPWQIPYNNWSWKERCAVIPIQEAAFRRGRLERPTTCCICGFYGPGKCDGRWQIILHLERYDHPLEICPVCRPCHNALHARFTNPERWLRVLYQHPGSEHWFHKLSMDHASQRRTFAETYPDGLPRPTVSYRQGQLEI